MRWLLFALGLLAGVGYLLHRIFAQKPLSSTWFADLDRREWTKGTDGVNWSWPIRK